MHQKPKLTAPEQINHLKSKGVLFTIDSEEMALNYLNKNNNYFKLRAYRKNYVKNLEGQYVGLEFAYLRDLAIIDMRVRYCLLHMCLDIEHSARVRLIKKTEDSNEDGYSIVEDYFSARPELRASMNDQAIRSPYCRDLIISYENKMPVWVFVELAQFGQLVNFYRFTADRLQDKDMVDEFYYLQEVRQIRNACAHSNCILNDLKSQKSSSYRPNYELRNALVALKISPEVCKRKLSNDRIRQIATVLYFYKRFVKSTGLMKYQTRQLHEVFVRRMSEHLDYYCKAEPVQTAFAFFRKIVEAWYPSKPNWPEAPKIWHPKR